jgi:hypothetical protein
MSDTDAANDFRFHLDQLAKFFVISVRKAEDDLRKRYSSVGDGELLDRAIQHALHGSDISRSAFIATDRSVTRSIAQVVVAIAGIGSTAKHEEIANRIGRVKQTTQQTLQRAMASGHVARRGRGYYELTKAGKDLADKLSGAGE